MGSVLVTWLSSGPSPVAWGVGAIIGCVWITLRGPLKLVWGRDLLGSSLGVHFLATERS